MSDYTAMTVLVTAPKELLPRIATLVESYFGEFTGGEDPEKPDEVDLSWEGADVRCGSAGELALELDKLMKTGVEGEDEYGLDSMPPTPFAYKIYEDPKYEWLGDMHIRVPLPDGGYLDFTSECDANGGVVVGPTEILRILHEAKTLEEARERAARLVGEEAQEAWSQYVPPPMPEQMTLEEVE